MNPQTQQRIINLARRACAPQRHHLTHEDWEDIQQEALLAYISGATITRTWWAAHDAATRAQGGRRRPQPTLIPLDPPHHADDHQTHLAAVDNPENEACWAVTLTELEACMEPKEWRAVAGTVLDDRPWADVCAELATSDGTVSRWRRSGLIKARRVLTERYADR